MPCLARTIGNYWMPAFAGMTTRERAGLPPERPAVAALIGRLIGDPRMVGAVGQARDGAAAAEEEVRLPRIADRPAAGLLGELEQGPALAHWDDVVDELGLGIELDLVGVGERRVAPHRGPRHPQHLAVGSRLARPRCGRARRLGAAGESEPVHLAEHRVAGHAAELGGDLTRRQSLAPKLLQRLDAFVSPAHGLIPRLSPRRRSPDRIQLGLGNDRLAQTPTFSATMY